MSKKEDDFENGIFWELYNDLERQFQNFLEYIPYLKGNEDVYSFRLLNLILSIGGHVDSAFKEMARYPGFLDNEECVKILEKLRKTEENIKKGEPPITVSIKSCLRAFEKEYKLSERKVIFKRLPEREDITPFKPHNPETNAPEWWEIYNGLKHDVSTNIRKASLQNTLKALAGAFLLNVNHTPSIFRLIEYGIVKPRLRGPITFKVTKEGLEDFFKKRKLMDMGFAETLLFIYDYSQNKEGMSNE